MKSDALNELMAFAEAFAKEKASFLFLLHTATKFYFSPEFPIYDK